VARYNQEQHEEGYRYYITDLLYYYMDGKMIGKRFYDVMHETVETRDAETIIQDTIKKAGLVIE